MGRLPAGQISKKRLAEIDRRYRAPKDATKEAVQKIARNKTAAIWRAKNPEKVRAASRAYAQKVKKDKGAIVEQLEKGTRPVAEGNELEEIALSNGPQLMYEGLSYGSKINDGVRAAWKQAEERGRKVIGLIKNFDGKIKGPFLTYTGFAEAIQTLYGEGIGKQKQSEKLALDVSDEDEDNNDEDEEIDLKSIGDYPMISSGSTDDGKTVYITVTATMLLKTKARG